MSLTRVGTRVVAIASLLCGASVGATAHAADSNKAACIAAFEGAAELRSSGKLLEARKRLAECAGETCPGSVQKECGKELELVNAALPSVVLTAHDQTGRDVVRGRLLIDNVASELHGLATSLDPGRHAIRLEAEGCDPAEEEVLIVEAEKNRKIAIALQCSVPGAVASRPAAPPRSAPPAPESSSPSRALPIAFASVGAVGLLGFAYFGLKGGGELSDIRNTGCAPDCDRDAVMKARTHLVVGDVFGAVGVIGIGAAVFTLLSSGKTTPATAISAGPTPSGGSVTMMRAF